MSTPQTRRRFLTTLSLAGAVGILPPQVLAAEGDVETTTVRLPKSPGICIAPGYLAEGLLRAEGFTDVRYVDLPETTAIPIEAVARKIGRASCRERVCNDV